MIEVDMLSIFWLLLKIAILCALLFFGFIGSVYGWMKYHNKFVKAPRLESYKRQGLIVAKGAESMLGTMQLYDGYLEWVSEDKEAGLTTH